MANGNNLPPVLGENDLSRINTGIENLNAADAVIEMAKRAGIPVSDFETKSRTQREQLLKIKNTFFPGR